MRSIRNDFFFEEVEKQISLGESVEIFVRGRSMAPYLKDGVDKVALSPFEPSELKKGDIVLFFNSGDYFLHRIIKRKENVFTMQGDGNIKTYEEVLLSDIIGIVSFKIDCKGKYINVSRLSHHIYWRCWLLLRPLRRQLLFFYFFLK